MVTSGFYAWLRRSESLRNLANRRLLLEIKVVDQRSRQTYGSPRVHAELNTNGHTFGKHRMAHLMRTHSIVSRDKRKFSATTNAKHAQPVAANILKRQFTTSAPNH